MFIGSKQITKYSDVLADYTDKGENFMPFKMKWKVPHKRAKQWAEERKNRVHMHGKKEGQELTPYEAGLRSGYLQCQTDHASIFNYKKRKEAERVKGGTK